MRRGQQNGQILIDVVTVCSRVKYHGHNTHERGDTHSFSSNGYWKFDIGPPNSLALEYGPRHDGAVATPIKEAVW